MTKSIILQLILISLFAIPVSNAATIYVDQNATGTPDGTDWVNAYTDIQNALAAAIPGTEIWVAEGIYLPGPSTSATFQLLNGVSLFGGFSGTELSLDERDWIAHPTQLSGDIGQDDFFGSGPWYTNWYVNTANAVHIVTGSGTDNSAVIDGFTITHGYTSYLFATSYFNKAGAGMFNVDGSPTVRNCTFYRNAVREADGGAIFNSNSSPIIENCAFIENFTRFGKGAGIYNSWDSSPTIEGCTFSGNISMAGTLSLHSASGTAICHNTTAKLNVHQSIFEDNEAIHFIAVGTLPAYGAGIYSLSTDMQIDACTFSGNKADAGAAIADRGNNSIISNSLFIDNTTFPFYPSTIDQGNYGGGIATISTDSTAVTRILNCTFIDNTAGSGAAIGGSGNAMIANSILYGNISTAAGATLLDAQVSGNFIARYSCIEGLPSGLSIYPGCINIDPLLSATQIPLLGSPVVDMGDNTIIPNWVKFDLLGNARFVDDPATTDGGLGSAPLVDMGALEFIPNCNNGNSPEGLVATPTDPSHVDLSWFAVFDADKYQINGNLLGSPPALLVSSVNSKLLSGLSPGATYYWKVRAKCITGGENTPFSLTDTFTMPAMKTIGSKLTLEVFPNPASSTIDINIDNGSSTVVEVWNANGQLMYSKLLSQNNTNTTPIIRLNVEEWPNGFYIVEINTEDQKTHSKLEVLH